MRYLSAITISMPIFCVAVVWGAVGLPIFWVVVAIVAFAGLGIILGRYMNLILAMYLLDGRSHFLLQRTPGGIWFFLGLGVVGGLAAVSVLAVFGLTTGWLILRAAALAFGALCCAAFGTIALAVLRLERTEGKHVYMDPDGFFLLDA